MNFRQVTKSLRTVYIEGKRCEVSKKETGVLHKMKKERSEKLIRILNKYSLLFHVVLACGVCFLIEWVSRHSFIEACQFMVDRNLVFLYNAMIVYASLLLVYLVKRRAVMRVVISVFWTFLGIINGCVLAKRVTPFGFTDIKMIGDLFTMQSNYFSVTEAVIVIIAVSLVIFGIVVLWIRGPKFKGKLHPILGTCMILTVAVMIPQVTDAAVDNNILTSYFENLAQGYKDYGFVYSFSASVLDRCMSAPEGYSEEAIEAVLANAQDSGNLTANSSTEDERVSASLQTQSNVKTTSQDVETEQVSQEETTSETSEELNTENTEEEIPKDVDKTEQ